MGEKTYLFDLIQQCTYINKFMALRVSSSIVSYLSPGLDNNQLPPPVERGECDSERSCDELCLLLCVSVEEMFTGAFCVASRIPLSVNDGSCEGASGKCDSKLWLLGLMQHIVPAAQAAQHSSEHDGLWLR